MEPLLVLLAAVPLAGVAGWLARLGREDRRILQGWLLACRQWGVTDLEMGSVGWRVPPVTGRSGDSQVRLEWREPIRGPSGTTILIRNPSLVSLFLRREGSGTDLENRFAPQEIEVGDETFDALFFVRGPHLEVRAVLNTKTRRDIGALLGEAGLEIANGELRAHVAQSRYQSPDDPRLARVLSRMLVVAKRLRRPADVLARVARNAGTDRHAGVRLQNLRALVHERPDDPITRGALRRACDDRSDEVRVHAATLLGDDGRETLMDVAGAPDSQDEWAARAVTQLGRRVPPPLTKEWLERALRRRHVETARACLANLGSDGWPEGLDALAGVIAREQGGELATLAAQALGQSGLTGAERPLIEALTAGSPDLRVAAAEALGRVGSADAVSFLKEAEGRRAHEAAFRRAARQAIAEIHARTGAAAGQLSAAPTTAGTLSLVDGERGRLSLEPREPR